MQKNLMQYKEVTLTELLDSRESRVWHQRELLDKYGGVLISVTLNIPGPVKDKPQYRNVMEWGAERIEEMFGQLIVHREIRHLVTGSECYFVLIAGNEDKGTKAGRSGSGRMKNHETEPLEEFANWIKKGTIELEDSSADNGIGRILDIDVLFGTQFASPQHRIGTQFAETQQQTHTQPSTLQSQHNQKDIKSVSRSDLGYEPRRCLICNERAKVCARSQKHNIDDLIAKIDDICNFFEF